ncbi:hypothetical protein PVAG01_02928 [Phlyctema vagabunda]|uniref:Uncharacterized protein n=1 Tax=Phlyctema vagabunda TaxID=108571 RepID=A0ABR4PS33_9HELO
MVLSGQEASHSKDLDEKKKLPDPQTSKQDDQESSSLNSSKDDNNNLRTANISYKDTGDSNTLAAATNNGTINDDGTYIADISNEDTKDTNTYLADIDSKDTKNANIRSEDLEDADTYGSISNTDADNGGSNNANIWDEDTNGDDAVSVKSNGSLDSVFSTPSITSSCTSVYDSHGDAKERLISVLLENSDLEYLFGRTVLSMNREKFERNFRRLVKRFGMKLRDEGQSTTQKATGNFVCYQARDSAHIISGRLFPMSKRQALASSHPDVDFDDEFDDLVDSIDPDQDSSFDELERFVLSSDAFQNFIWEFKKFVLPNEITLESGQLPAAVITDVLPPESERQSLSFYMNAYFLLVGFHTAVVRLWNNEPELLNSKVRIKWKCKCGKTIFDDFEELEPGAAKRRELWLNRRHIDQTTTGRLSSIKVAAMIYNMGLSILGRIQAVLRGIELGGLGILGRIQAALSGTELGLPQHDSHTPAGDVNRNDTTRHMLTPGNFHIVHELTSPRGTDPAKDEDSFLLLCHPEARYATKLLQLRVTPLQSDYQLFKMLNLTYSSLRGSWRRYLSLYALKSIHFVHFEYYKKSRTVGIRKQPDVPPVNRDDYRYNPSPPDLLPPVGENELMHFLYNPECAEDGPVCLERLPKKLREQLTVCNGKLTEFGWGLHFVEGWSIRKIIWICRIIALGSLVWGVLWAVFTGSIQDGFTVSGYMVALAGLILAIAATQEMAEKSC